MSRSEIVGQAVLGDDTVHKIVEFVGDGVAGGQVIDPAGPTGRSIKEVTITDKEGGASVTYGRKTALLDPLGDDFFDASGGTNDGGIEWVFVDGVATKFKVKGPFNVLGNSCEATVSF